jgi:GntR family transcriptional regulator
MSGRQDNLRPVSNGDAPTAALLSGLAPIDRGSPLPLYSQLARALDEEISSGRWAPHARLPSEPELGAYFDLSRPTVRQALATLEQQGKVLRRRGRGTFVAVAAQRVWLAQAPEGFFDYEAHRQGRAVTSQTLSAKHGPLPQWATARLGLEPESTGATLERLRSVDGLVALYVVNHLPERFVEIAMSVAEPTASLYERLRERAGVVVAGGHRVVEAVPATKRLAKLLECRDGSPLVLIESVSWDADRRPFDCYRAWLRSDRLKVELEVTASAIAGASDAITA